jgi:hypothetical protein
MIFSFLPTGLALGKTRLASTRGRGGEQKKLAALAAAALLTPMRRLA